jgi:hypothetical protein
MGLPAYIRSGNSLSLVASYAGLSPTGWALLLAIRGAVNLDIAGVASGSSWTLSASSTQTAQLSPGKYKWAVLATSTDGTQRVEAESGEVEVLPNLATAAAGVELRSEAELVLASVDAAVSDWPKKRSAMITISGRSITYKKIEELLALRTRLREDVRREKIARGIALGMGGNNARRVLTRFGGNG